MHFCYALYVFICCCQPALFILSMALDKHLVCQMVMQTTFAVITGNSSNHGPDNNNTVQSDDEQQVLTVMSTQIEKLDRSVGYCSALTCCFALLYILVTRANEDFGFLHNGDDESAHTLVEDGGAPSGVQALEFARFCFWGLVMANGYVVSLVGSTVHDMQHLQVQIVCRCVAVWVLCRTGRSMRGKVPIYLGAGLYLYWMVGMLLGPHSTWKDVFIVFQIFLDLILFVGHRWDANASAMVTLNCRLCYMAGTSSAMLCTALGGVGV